MAYKTKRKRKRQPDQNPFAPVEERALRSYDRATADPGQSTEVIIALLTEIAEDGNFPPGDVFIDFLRLAEVMLDELPRHIRHINKTGQVDRNDPPEIRAFYQGLRERYPPQKGKRWVWGNMVAAVSVLVFISTEIYQDVIGQVYARFAHPDSQEVVIPFDEAVARAKKALGKKPAELVIKQLSRAALKAAKHNPLALAVLNAGLIGDKMAKTKMDDLWVEQFTRDNILPALLPHFEPLRVFDPALGSGTLIIACASLFPAWMVQLGIVQFEGSDPDPLALQMTILNAKIYGLNGYWLEANRALYEQEAGELKPLELFRADWQSLSEADLERLPESFRSLYAPGTDGRPLDEAEIKARRRARHLTLLNEQGD